MTDYQKAAARYGVCWAGHPNWQRMVTDDEYRERSIKAIVAEIEWEKTGEGKVLRSLGFHR